jgi:hypothetical protein
MKSFVRISLAFAALVVAAGTARAGEDPRKAAGEHYQRGLEIVSEHCRLPQGCGDYQAALDEFEQAYALSPNFEVLYNIGQANLALGRPRKAIDALERYLADGSEKVPPVRRAEVERQIAQLESSFGQLGVTTEPSGARVTVDGADIGTTPLSAVVKVVAGTHVVSASRPGAATVTRVVTLTEGQQETVNLALPDLPVASAPAEGAPGPVAANSAAEPATPAAVQADAAASHGQASRFPTGYVLIGAGVALGGVTVAHYLWNHGRVEDFRANEAELASDTSPGRSERQAENNALATSIQHASVVTVVLGVTSGALAAAGVVLVLTDHPAETAEKRAGPRGIGVELPSVAVTRDSLALSWRGRW